MLVKVGTFPGTVSEQAIADGANVRTALNQANITAGADSEIRVNGSISALDRTLVNGDIVLVSTKIKGNSAAEFIRSVIFAIRAAAFRN